MKIGIIDAYHDSDRGGAGILAGLINTILDIKKSSKLDIEMSIIYRISKYDKTFKSAYRHTIKSYPNIKILGSSKIKGWQGLSCFLIKMLKAKNSKDKTIKELNSCNFIFSKGGNFYTSYENNPLHALFHLMWEFYDVIFSIRLKKPIFFISHSFGPFRTKLARLLVKQILNRVTYISTREYISKQNLKNLGIEKIKITVLPDIAFALIPSPAKKVENFCKNHSIKRNDYVVITVVNWRFPLKNKKDQKKLYRNYIGFLAKISDYLIDIQYCKKILLVVHNDGKHSPRENDAKPVFDVYKLIKKKSSIIIINEDLSPQMQAGIYGSAKMMIGTRLHSVIFALVGGAPAIAISYTHKTPGIMQMLNLERYIIPIDAPDVKKTIELIEEIDRNRKEILVNTANKITHFRNELKQFIENIILEK